MAKPSSPPTPHCDVRGDSSKRLKGPRLLLEGVEKWSKVDQEMHEKIRVIPSHIFIHMMVNWHCTKPTSVPHRQNGL
jgi:hypothetical protein